MNIRTGLLSVLAAALLLFVVQGQAQHQGHHPDGQQQESTPRMGDMMSQHEQMQKLTGQLMQSFTDIRGEKDAQKLESKLAKHGALLEEFQALVKKQMAAMSDHMKNCSMMSSGHQHEEK